MDLIGGFPDLSEAAFDRLAKAFSEVRAQAQYSERQVNYEALCEVLQGKCHHSFAFRTGSKVLDEKYAILKIQVGISLTCLMCVRVLRLHTLTHSPACLLDWI